MRKSSLKGFTLVEVLITLAVISILIAAGAYTIEKATRSNALDRGAKMLHAMVRSARSQAIMNGNFARVIINADESDPDEFLRKVGVIVKTFDETAEKWIAVERGIVLPEGVYLVPQSMASVVVPGGLPQSVYKSVNGDSTEGTAVYQLKYPMKDSVSIGTTTDPSWICIQFAPNGRLSAANEHGSGLVPLSNQLILARGNWVDSKLEFRDESDYVGISFKRSGSSYQSHDSGRIDLDTDDEAPVEESESGSSDV